MPDLATDTGTRPTAARRGSSRSRTARSGRTARPITCADFKYGISRTFATDVITGGPNYAIQFLDSPRTPTAPPIYKGPYANDAKGQAAFDKAVHLLRATPSPST